MSTRGRLLEALTLLPPAPVYHLIDRLEQGPWTWSTATPDDRHAVAMPPSVGADEETLTEPVPAFSEPSLTLSAMLTEPWNGKTIELPNGVLLRRSRL